MQNKNTKNIHLAYVIVIILLVGLLSAINFRPSKKLNNSLKSEKNSKNIILYIGDGMGVSTITAGRIYVGQTFDQPGEEYVLNMDKFPYTAMVKTYNIDAMVPDSAGTASAIMTGEKTNIGYLSYESNIAKNECDKTKELLTIFDYAKKNNKKIGIVTNTRITHATPASAFAHTSRRDWEGDSDVDPNSNCQSIVTQLIKSEYPYDLILGGGVTKFSEANLSQYKENFNAEIIFSKDELKALEKDQEKMQKPILGLFSKSHMEFQYKNNTEPSLSEMVEFAIKKLKNDDGFLLLVEGGKIDHAHHYNQAGVALDEFKEFDNAIKVGKDLTNVAETLYLVTADHDHSFSMTGYGKRGGNILGNVEKLDSDGEFALDLNGNEYPVLGYLNGYHTDEDEIPSEINIERRYNSHIPLQSETHSGVDVLLLADGKNAENVHGVIEQSKIFNIMMDSFGFSTEEKKYK